MTDSKSVPQIAVVMAVRNGAQYVQAAIDSILRQDFPDFEFLVVNDGSSDETVNILRRQADPRIRVFHRDPTGLPAALNFGIRESKAALIARQDADDISEPARLGRLMAKLAAAPTAPLVHSGCYFDADLRMTVSSQYVPRTQALTALKLCVLNPVVHGSVMFRKCAFYAAGGYDEQFAQSQDYGLWSRMIEVGRFAYCSQKLYRFRLHHGSVSIRKARAQAAFREQIARSNCQRFFRVSDADAARIFAFLNRREGHSATAWLGFARENLPRLRYQSAELYLWAAVQVVRAALRPPKLRIAGNGEAGGVTPMRKS
jgi:glycosyltransferase involved in cell wall biosynthesis